MRQQRHKLSAANPMSFFFKIFILRFLRYQLDNRTAYLREKAGGQMHGAECLSLMSMAMKARVLNFAADWCHSQLSFISIVSLLFALVFV